MTSRFPWLHPRLVLALACLGILATYAALIDLKGISTDEGIRLAIINGGRTFTVTPPATPPTWDMVLKTGEPFAYQPLYYLAQNTLMRLAGGPGENLFRSANLGCLAVALLGLLALSRGWPLATRLFLLLVFSFNAYLFMHVLQIREYTATLAFCIWSTWVVFHLDRRTLAHPWGDVAWFTAYGVLLALGFFLQSWVVFPAIAQGVFLVLRRRPDPVRFLSHLALSYLVVCSVAWPYLRSHSQRADVGRWGTEGTPLLPQLSDGLHLVLGGHLAGQSRVAEFLCWFWPAVIVLAAGLLLVRKSPGPAADARAGYLRQGWLMLLAIGLTLAFQIVYFLKVDTLSVWPRYFVIHYFFVTWLLALAFRYGWDLRATPALAAGTRRLVTLALALVAGVAVTAAVFQTQSFRRDPYLDTGVTPDDNWRTLAAELDRALQPGDTIMTIDFVQRSTLTFTRPTDHSVILLTDLPQKDLSAVRRLVYLEPAGARDRRDELTARIAAAGLTGREEIDVFAPDGRNRLTNWRLLVFTRRP